MMSLLSRNGYASIRKQFIRTVTDSSATVIASENLKPWQKIPGPPSLPIVGQLLNFLPGGKFSDQNTALAKIHKEYGPIVRLNSLLGRPPQILLFDAASCEHILRSENVMPSRPGFPSLTYYRTNENRTKEELAKPMGLLIDEKEKWQQFRSAVNPVMLQPKTIKLYKTSIENVAEEMVERMKTIRDENQMIRDNFELEVNLWALESIGVIALGRRLNCFDPNLPEDSPEKKLIQCLHDFFTVCDQLDFQPSLWRYYPTKTFKKAMKVYEDTENITKYLIRKTIDAPKNDQVKSDEEKSVLEKLLEKDEDTAVIMACDMLFAGVDTTATIVTGILYHLATNQEKQKKLREELSSNESRTYLKACIKESLRISPLVERNLRKTSKEHNLLGYCIPKDMMVSLCHEVISVQEGQFTRPQEFIPERWIEEDSPLYYKEAHPFAYVPFGFGVRHCIGRRIAELELETFIEKVIQNFQVEWRGPPLAVKRSAHNYLIGPFDFVFKDL